MSTAATNVAHHADVEHEEDNSLTSWLTTVDHKRIGKLYMFSALFFFALGGLEALLIRLQLMWPENHFISAQTYNEMFTMHATTMIFLSIMPLSAAFFNFLIPLQIGARDVAFPRLNALSYWLFLFGALFLNFSFFFSGLPDGGWFGYANMTLAKYSPGHSIDFWILGLAILGNSSMMAGFNFITTILNLRTPGMTMFRMPIFTWMSLVVQFLIVMSFPMITVGLLLMLFDRSFGTNFYFPPNGGDPLLWQHLFWLFGHPEVYILILPAMGIVSEILPVAARKPLFGAPFVIFSGIMIGFVGFGVWSHHMFTTGLGPVADAAFSTTTMLIAVPTAVKIFNWIATLWGGKIRFTVPAVFAITFVFLFTIGGLSGVMHASPPVDLQQQDSYFIVAHFHYVLVGGAFTGLMSGVYFYWPKMFGRYLDERAGWISWVLLFIGINLTFFPMHFLGAMGMPRRTWQYPVGAGYDMWNMVATVGSWFIAVGFLVTLASAVANAFFGKGKKAPADPWDAATLEWSIASPPPHYNFKKLPTVASDRPYWDEKHEGGPAVSQEVIAVDAPSHVEMPPPSWWPLGQALFQGGFFAAFLIGGGTGQFDADRFMIQLPIQLLLAAGMLYCMFGWIREDARPR
ncbi:MAG: cytochrome c oxidase subunit I [Alphaproteobacteria bacterium]|nr:cytochrome c oxidase subunit I [Alphaproteobacteria bacterium]